MGLLGKLFKNKKKALAPIDMGAILLSDVHSHLLPGIDDGAKSMEDSILLLQHFQQLNFKKVITTPHIMSDHYRNTPEIILDKLTEVQAEIKKQGLLIEIEAAAEYYLDFDFTEKIGKEKLLTFGRNHLLFELSFLVEPHNLQEVIFELISTGYKPILAHVERYSYWHRRKEVYADLKNRGVLFQLNALSLIGEYGKEVQKIAEWMVEEEMIDLVGSDCHHERHAENLQLVSTCKSYHNLLNQRQLQNKIF